MFASHVPTGMPRRTHRPHRRGGRVARLVFGLVLAVLAVYILGHVGLLGTAGERLRASSPDGVSAALDQVFGTAHTLWAGITQFLNPVVATYGNATTILLFAVLILALGYWGYARL